MRTNGTNAVNGFDSLGHYIRTEAIVGGCTAYSKITVGGCSANFTHQTLSEAPDASYNGALLAASYAQQNRSTEAARAVEAVRRVDPAFDADAFGTQLRQSADRERVREGLRKAGF